MDDIPDEQNGFGRFGAVLSLVGGPFGPLQREAPSDPNVIRARLTLLNSVTVTDERLSGMVDTTKKNLQNLLDGKPVENPFAGRLASQLLSIGSAQHGLPNAAETIKHFEFGLVGGWAGRLLRER